MSLKKSQKATFKKSVPIVLQDGTRGTIDVEFNQLTQQRIDELLEDNTANSDVFDEIVSSVSGINDDDGKPYENQRAIAASDPAIVAQVVGFFFESTRPAKPGSKTFKKPR